MSDFGWRHSAITSGLVVLGLLGFSIGLVACPVPWWFMTFGLPFFGVAVGYGSRRVDRTTPAWRGILRGPTVLAILGLVGELTVSGAMLVRDLETYGTAFRAGCTDEGDSTIRTAAAFVFPSL